MERAIAAEKERDEAKEEARATRLAMVAVGDTNSRVKD